MNTFRSSSVRIGAVLILLLAVAGIFGQNNNRSSISGFVFGEDRRPLAQVYVELRDEVESTIGRVRTDNSGRYFFGGLSQGRFTVRALPMGTNYQEQSVDVEIYGYGASGRQLADAVQRDIYLKLRKGADAVPFVNAVIFAQEVPAEAEAAYERGSAYLNDKKRDEGIAELKKAIDIFPNYFIVLQKLGIIYISDQKYDEAKKMFQRSLDVNKESFDSLYGLGYSEYGLGNYEPAVETSEKALALKPDSLEVNLLLGVAYRQIKQYDKSEKAFLKAEDLADGTAPDVHYQLALLYAHNLKRYGDAAKQLELFLKEAPDAKDKDALKKLIKQFKEKDDKK